MKKATKIIGREKEIAWIWQTLESQSVVLTSLRRMGKSMLLKKMAEQPKKGWKAVYHPVQGNTSVEDFVQGLYNVLIESDILPSGSSRIAEFYKKFLAGQEIKGYKLPDLQRHWKEILTTLLEDLAEKKNLQLVIMLDELPWMVYNLATQYKKEADAMELLDVLRTGRQLIERKSNIRFIFCGSIGFNIVLNHLTRQHRYLGNPTNDMYTFNLEEMSPEDAAALCKYLGEIRKISNTNDLFKSIANSTQNLPYYINLVFIELSKGFFSSDKNGLKQVINSIVKDITGNGHFDHFRERLDAYYDKEYSRIAYQMLACLCESEKPLSRNEIVQSILRQNEADEDLIKQIIKDLTQDFYLSMDDRQYDFRYKLLKDWWLTHYA